MDCSFLESNRVVPVVVLKKTEDTVPTLSALKRGGINAAEITFRTECAAEAIALAVREFPDMLIGAGTVTDAAQCEKAYEAGAKFIVSPGFSPAVAEVCAKYGLPYLAGVVTPTEIMAAKACGLTVLKFFPAGVYGGVKALKALSAAFPDLRFVPTGGVDEKNLAEFLALPCVAAVGGSFMFKEGIDGIERLSRLAVEIAEANK